jgi:hypothetical protein
MADHDEDPAQTLARMTFLITMAGAAIAIGVALFWVIL